MYCSIATDTQTCKLLAISKRLHQTALDYGIVSCPLPCRQERMRYHSYWIGFKMFCSRKLKLIVIWIISLNARCFLFEKVAYHIPELLGYGNRAHACTDNNEDESNHEH